MNVSAVTTALMGLLGIMVGAWVQHFYSRRLEERRQLRDLRAKACTDFIKALSDLAHSNRQNRSNPEATRDLSDAKARIAIYGTPSVVQAMASFLRVHDSLGQAAADELVRLAMAMRRDTDRPNVIVKADDLRVLLVGSDR
jgi:hypothetical protein